MQNIHNKFIEEFFVIGVKKQFKSTLAVSGLFDGLREDRVESVVEKSDQSSG
jgi:hypothetical protein